MLLRAVATVLAGAFLMGAAAPDHDPYTWMEEIEGARALDWAKAEKLQRVHSQILAENTPMLELCRHLGFEIALDPDDVSVKQVALNLDLEATDMKQNLTGSAFGSLQEELEHVIAAYAVGRDSIFDTIRSKVFLSSRRAMSMSPFFSACNISALNLSAASRPSWDEMCLIE